MLNKCAGAFTHIYAAASLVLLLTLFWLLFFSKGTEEPYIYSASVYRQKQKQKARGISLCGYIYLYHSGRLLPYASAFLLCSNTSFLAFFSVIH